MLITRTCLNRVAKRTTGACSRRFVSQNARGALSTQNDVDGQNGWGILMASSAAVAAASLYSLSNTQATQLDAAAVVMDTSNLSVAETEQQEKQEEEDEDGDETTMILNWSGTHAVHVANKNYWEPESVEELERIVQDCHTRGQPIRPVGSALSPNGISFHPEGMVSLSNLDQVIHVDLENNTVKVQAGARVSQVIEALRPYGRTLPNLASIAEQQMGGFVQVGAHGTGAQISPVDHYVTELTLVTPGKGTMTLTEEQHGELFHLAKVGVGCLGVVADVTMKIIPAHNLVEHTFVLTRQQAKDQLDTLLKEHKHMRYMWLPYTDAVVVVTNDPEDSTPASVPRNKMFNDEDTRFAPLRELLIELSKNSPEPYTMENLKGVGFGELRDALLRADPVNVEHVKKCNEAEAEFWRRSEGYQTKPSDQLLQFDCGGQQWVWETCFPTGSFNENNGNDMEFMEILLKGIEEKGIAAPCPIEQRWSASSSSLMSPAHGTPDGLHSWVGIIMYLPSDDEMQRRIITEKFTGEYCELMRSVGKTVNAASHWAKLELPKSVWQIVDLQLEMSQRYPLHMFNNAREMLDPKNILANPLLTVAFGRNKD